MKVYWSAEAAHRLREIAAYIGADSPAAAQKVVASLLNGSSKLSEPPLPGRRLPEFPDSDLRELLIRPYRLIFMENSRGIEIVTVMHYRQLLPADLGAFEVVHDKGF